MFFGRAKKLKQVDRDVEHAGIIKDYYKALEIAGNEFAPIIQQCFFVEILFDCKNLFSQSKDPFHFLVHFFIFGSGSR